MLIKLHKKLKMNHPAPRLIKNEYLCQISCQLRHLTAFWSQRAEHEPALVQPQLPALAQVEGS